MCAECGVGHDRRGEHVVAGRPYACSIETGTNMSPMRGTVPSSAPNCSRNVAQETHFGVEAYLLTAGLSPDDLALVRSRLLE